MEETISNVGESRGIFKTMMCQSNEGVYETFGISGKCKVQCNELFNTSCTHSKKMIFFTTHI